MRKIVRLTEGDVKRMVKIATKKYLREMDEMGNTPNYFEMINDYIRENESEIPESDDYNWDDVAMCAYEIIRDSICDGEFEVTLGDNCTVWSEGNRMFLEDEL